MTEWLRTPTGTMQLFPTQARALLEVHRCKQSHGVGGLFFSGRVGVGKSLTAGLVPTVLGLKRPLLVTTAGARDSTIDLLAQYRRHWQIPPISVVSYDKISRRSPEERARLKAGEDPGPGFLDLFQPDGLLFDEVHLLKSVGDGGSARARRVARWIHEHPEVPVCGFTGTPIRKSFNDWAHVVVWCLKRGAPVPLDPDVQKEWALLLDDELPTRQGFVSLPKYEILHPHLGSSAVDRASARLALQDRLLATPGVVVSADSYNDVPLSFAPLRLPSPEVLDDHWKNLRTLYVAPDGWMLADKQLGVWGVAGQLALGFYYRHDPRPPKDWADARREWCTFCRRVLEESQSLDTELDVRNACLGGRLPRQAWDIWDAIKNSYEPTVSPVWLSRHALHAAAAWGPEKGIIWTDYRAFGEALSEMTGWPYYGAGGKDASGRRLKDARSDQDPTIIVATRVAEVGMNLQGDPVREIPGYCHNLFTTPPRAAADWEQRAGRTHRHGQTCPVSVQYFVGCAEHLAAMPLSIALAEMSKDSLMPAQKLLQWRAETPPMSWAQGPAYGDLSTNKD